MPVGYPLTPREQFIVRTSIELMPERFRATATPERILSFIELVIADINVCPPFTTFNADSVPDTLVPVVRLGCSFYALMFQEMRATLDDFEFSDQGLTVRIDQVQRINTVLQNMAKSYEKMVINYKKTLIPKMGAGLGSPRYQSQLGQFLKISLGSSFSWNSY